MAKSDQLVLMSALFVRPIVEHAQKLDLDLSPFFSEKEWLDFKQILASNLAVPANPTRMIFERALHEGKKDFGLDCALIAAKQHLIPSFQHLYASSHNLYQFLNLLLNEINGHLSLFNFFDLEACPEGLYLRRDPKAHFDLGSELAEVYTHTVLIELISEYLGRPWRPKMIWLKHSESSVAFESYLSKECHIFHGKEISKLVLQDSILNHKGELYRQASYNPMPPLTKPTVTETLQQSLMPFAMDALPSIELMSKIHGLHPKQLQLRLREEGTHYRDLVLNYRADQARNLILNTDFSQQRIAVEVGYQNTTHFIRAMKKVWGMTPKQYARAMRVERG